MFYEWKDLQRLGYVVHKIKEVEYTTDGESVPTGWCALFDGVFVAWGLPTRREARQCCSAHRQGMNRVMQSL